MGKSKKDAKGSHFRRDKTYYGADGHDFYGWTPAFKRWAKDRSNRELRRQHKKVTKAVLAQYEIEQQDDIRMYENIYAYEDPITSYYDDMYEANYANDWRYEIDELERREYKRDYYDDYGYDDYYDGYGYPDDYYEKNRVERAINTLANRLDAERVELSTPVFSNDDECNGAFKVIYYLEELLDQKERGTLPEMESLGDCAERVMRNF